MSCLYLIEQNSPINLEIHQEIQCLKVILYAAAIIQTPEVIVFLLGCIDMVLIFLQGFHVRNKHSIHETLDANGKRDLGGHVRECLFESGPDDVRYVIKCSQEVVLL